MSIAITVSTYLFSTWNVNVLVLFSVVLAVVILPGTGLKRMIRSWFSKRNENTTKKDSNSLPSANNLKKNPKMRAEYDNAQIRNSLKYLK